MPGAEGRDQFIFAIIPESTPWKRPWCWERLKAKREGGGRGWDGCMASPTWWPRTWANSERQWRTEKSGMLQSMGLQRVRHNLATANNPTLCQALRMPGPLESQKALWVWPHYPDWQMKTQVQKGEVTYPRPSAFWVAELRLEPRMLEQVGFIHCAVNRRTQGATFLLELQGGIGSLRVGGDRVPTKKRGRGRMQNQDSDQFKVNYSAP